MPASRGDPFELLLAFDAVTTNPLLTGAERLVLLQAIQGSMPPQASSPKLIGSMQKVLNRVIQDHQAHMPKPVPKPVSKPAPQAELPLDEVPDPDPDLHKNKPGAGRPRDALKALGSPKKKEKKGASKV